jgi:parallel beta-helix repeat protein
MGTVTRTNSVHTIFVALLLFCTLFSVGCIQLVRAGGTIYIRADGRVDPANASVSTVDYVTYTLTGNITSDADGLVIERDNIVVDGAGYTIQCAEVYNIQNSIGIYLQARSNVTIRNMTIAAFECGICLNSSSYSNIHGNNITDNWHRAGIYLIQSIYNSISGNNITNNWGGVFAYSSDNNSIDGNMFANDGLFGENSFGNVVEDNLVNGKPLVYLWGVSDFRIENAGQVILVDCDDISVENLNLSCTDVGIQLWNTTNTIMAANNITNNNYEGIRLYYSSNNSIVDNNITANFATGIWLGYSSCNNSVVENNITKNNDGLQIYLSSFNNISANKIADNWDGIWLLDSSGNIFYHNNFLYNRDHVSSIVSTDIWDYGYPLGGNYWSTHNPVDENKDKIGDAPYIMNDNNTDGYPLVYPFECYAPGYLCSPDLNRDGQVNIIDVSGVARAFGCRPGDPNWNPIVDMDLNEVINIVDISKVAREFGREWKEMEA